MPAKRIEICSLLQNHAYIKIESNHLLQIFLDLMCPVMYYGVLFHIVKIYSTACIIKKAHSLLCIAMGNGKYENIPKLPGNIIILIIFIIFLCILYKIKGIDYF